MTEIALRTRSVSRRFGELVAVDGVDLEIRSGEVYGFLGANGAGKSTLIRMLMGLLSPSSGEIEVLGMSLPQDAEALRPLAGYMPQKFSLYEDLSVEENLDFSCEVFNVGGDRRDRVEAALEEYGLCQRRHQRPATLSGGWKQRLALAAATIHDPRLLFLDEPTAGVDPENRRLFWEKIFDLTGKGTTILVSTHYMDEAQRCYRLGMMRSGRKSAEGAPSDLCSRLDGRIVQLRLEQLNSALPVLRKLDMVASVAQIGNSLRILLRREAPAAQDALVHLTAPLVEGGLGPVEALASEPDLEDVFVALTCGETLDGMADQHLEPGSGATPESDRRQA